MLQCYAFSGEFPIGPVGKVDLGEPHFDVLIYESSFPRNIVTTPYYYYYYYLSILFYSKYLYYYY